MIQKERINTDIFAIAYSRYAHNSLSMHFTSSTKPAYESSPTNLPPAQAALSPSYHYRRAHEPRFVPRMSPPLLLPVCVARLLVPALSHRSRTLRDTFSTPSAHKHTPSHIPDTEQGFLRNSYASFTCVCKLVL